MDGVAENWQMSEEENRIPLHIRNSYIILGGVISYRNSETVTVSLMAVGACVWLIN